MSLTKEAAEAAGWVFKLTVDGVEAVKQFAESGYSSTELHFRDLTDEGLLGSITQRELQLGGASGGAPAQTVSYPGGVTVSDAEHVGLQGQGLQPVNGSLPDGAQAAVEADATAEGQVSSAQETENPAQPVNEAADSTPTETSAPEASSPEVPAQVQASEIAEKAIERDPAVDPTPAPSEAAVPVDSTPAADAPPSVSD